MAAVIDANRISAEIEKVKSAILTIEQTRRANAARIAELTKERESHLHPARVEKSAPALSALDKIDAALAAIRREDGHDAEVLSKAQQSLVRLEAELQNANQANERQSIARALRQQVEGKSAEKILGLIAQIEAELSGINEKNTSIVARLYALEGQLQNCSSLRLGQICDQVRSEERALRRLLAYRLFPGVFGVYGTDVLKKEDIGAIMERTCASALSALDET